MANLDIESVPFFDRPQSSGPKDRFIGKDEAGNSVFETVIGEVYTIKPAADQRTTRTKIEEDVVPAVKEYIRDPSLPSAEQMKQFGVDAVTGAYESVSDAVRGRGTYGDVFGVAGAGTIKEAIKPNLPENKTYIPAGIEGLEVPSSAKYEALQKEADWMLGEGSVTNLYPTFETVESAYDLFKDGFEDTAKGSSTGLLKEVAENKLKAMNALGKDFFLTAADEIPHWKDKKYSSYLDKLEDVSKENNLDFSAVKELVFDLDSIGQDIYGKKVDPFLDKELTETPLPYKEPIGERAKMGEVRPSDKKAYDLGFNSTVYHTTISPEEFTEFDLSRDTGPDSYRSAQDFLGVHVGNARAAAERHAATANRGSEREEQKGFTMELRARTDKPVTEESLKKDFGFSSTEDTFKNGLFTEAGINELIDFYGEKFGDPVGPRSDDAIALRKALAEKGYTHLPYLNDIEDPGSTSLIMLVDRPKNSPAVLRDVRAKFDPDKITDPDLRFAEGGTVENQMDNLYNEGGLAEKATGGNPILNHHKNNLKNNPVFNDDGTISTVRTIIVGDGKYEYLIPTVWDGKILSDEDAFKRAMESGIRWPQVPSGEEGVRALERLDEKLHESISTKYNKGGVVEKQMNRLYQEGGLADDGARVEPVTGNEVPPGSLSEEVRDNVDAKLSEGEYVVPADVVRYYGVRFFEDLRAKAKEDFSKMESEGRIGGEPVNAQGVPMEDDELTPEEMQMLAEALGQAPQGMAMGGMVQQQPIPAYNPYAQQQMQYNNPNTPMPVGMAFGGMVRPQQQQQQPTPEFNPSQYQLYPSGNQMGAGSGGGIEIVDYINVETGQIRPITLINGQPMGLVPEGFVRATPENRTQAMENAGMASEQMGEKTTEEVLDVTNYDFTDSESDQRRREQAGQTEASNKNWAEKNYDKIVEDPVGYIKEQLSDKGIKERALDNAAKLGSLAGPAGTLIGGAIQVGDQLGDISKSKAALELAKAQGLVTPEEINDLTKMIDDATGDLSGVASWIPEDKYDGTDRLVALNEVGGTRTSTGTPSTTSKPKEKLFVPSAKKKTSTEDGAGEERLAQERYEAFQKEYEENAKDAQENQYGQTTGKGLTVEDIEDDLMPMAEGGLVAKPSKYKSKVTRKTEKKRRGLGSK